MEYCPNIKYSGVASLPHKSACGRKSSNHRRCIAHRRCLVVRGLPALRCLPCRRCCASHPSVVPSFRCRWPVRCLGCGAGRWRPAARGLWWRGPRSRRARPLQGPKGPGAPWGSPPPLVQAVAFAAVVVGSFAPTPSRSPPLRGRGKQGASGLPLRRGRGLQERTFPRDLEAQIGIAAWERPGPPGPLPMQSKAESRRSKRLRAPPGPLCPGPKGRGLQGSRP